jgi:class 3 adenylate cyclase/tetratricopeptide (TPR) repeat protein
MTAERREMPSDVPFDAERRHVAVMFCDVVGSTRLSEELDAEELRDVIRSYQVVVADAVVANEGHVAQYLGDGILAYFGYPAAHEDDARRAVRAALAIVDGVATLAKRLEAERRPSIAVRIGIESGIVVVGEMGAGGRTERLAIGEIPIIAARLQTSAPPNHIVIGELTRRLVDGLFELTALGPQSVKGLSRDIEAYIVGADAGATLVASSAAPLFARERELAIIDDAFATAVTGRGRVVEVRSEPGIGKSRLLAAAQARFVGVAHDHLVLRCSPYTKNTELYPVIAVLNRRFGAQPGEPAKRVLDRIVDLVTRSTALPDASVALFAALLSLPIPAGTPVSDRSTREQRAATLDALVTLLVDAARRRPQVLVAEDLQWADPSTVELLAEVLDRIDTSAVLCLFAYRPEFDPPWSANPAVTQLRLDRLGAEDSAKLVRAVAGGTGIGEALVQKVVRRTDGVPLFVEELTKAIVESEGNGGPADSEIPATLHGSLMARLDRLGADAKALAQVASVLGRDVSGELLAVVTGLDATEVQNHLGTLAAADLLRPPTDETFGAWSFKHALIQETAYGSMLRSARRRHHRAVADALTHRFPNVALAQPELVALHWREAGEAAAAVEWFSRAGSTALARSAAKEAQAHFREALAMLHSTGLDDTSTEITLQVGLGGACIVSDGYVTPDVERAFGRALEIGSQSGDGPELLPALNGLWLHSLIGGRFAEAVALSERIGMVSDQLGIRNLTAEAKYSRGLTALFMGDAALARDLLSTAVDMVDPRQPRSLITEHRADASYRVFLAVALWLTGSARDAAETGARAVELADAYEHPYTLGTVLAWYGVLLQLLGREDEAAKVAARGVAVSEAHGLQFWQIASALVVTSSSPPDERVQALPVLMAGYRAMGARVMETHFGLRLADGHHRLHDDDAALRVLADTANRALDTGQLWLEPERLRMEAEILRDQGGSDVEVRLWSAITLARKQGSAMLERRAMDALGRPHTR